VESPSLEIFQPRLDTVLCPLLWVTLLGQGVGLGDPQRALPPLTMLGFCECPVSRSSASERMSTTRVLAQPRDLLRRARSLVPVWRGRIKWCLRNRGGCSESGPAAAGAVHAVAEGDDAPSCFGFAAWAERGSLFPLRLVLFGKSLCLESEGTRRRSWVLGSFGGFWGAAGPTLLCQEHRDGCSPPQGWPPAALLGRRNRQPSPRARLRGGCGSGGERHGVQHGGQQAVGSVSSPPGGKREQLQRL